MRAINSSECIRKFGKHFDQCDSDDICKDCGKRFGKHYGSECPDEEYIRKLKLKPEPNKYRRIVL